MRSEDHKELKAPSVEDYKKAATKLFECKPEELELIQCYTDGPYLVRYADGIYEINSVYDLDKLAESYLTDFHQAMLLPIELWIEVAEGVHLETDFYINLLPELNEKEQAKLTQILTISNALSNPIEAFWELLYSLHDIDIYPRAVLAAAETYNLDAMVSEVAELLVENGKEYLNELNGGIFEIVDLDEDDENGESELFYIFSVDDVHWGVSEEMNNLVKGEKTKTKSAKTKKSK